MKPLPPAPGRHRGPPPPGYLIEIYLSPQLREREPARPLTVLEALPAGQPQRPGTSAPGPQAEPAAEPAVTWTGRQLRGKLRRARDGLTAGPPPPAHPASGREGARAARSVSCPCTALPGTPCSPVGDHLARYLHAGQSGAITRPDLTRIIAGLDVIAPHVVVPPGHDAAPAEHCQPFGPAPAAAIRRSPELEAGT